MKAYRKELWFNLSTRRGFVNITPEVELSPHRAAALLIHETDAQTI
jgi:thiamine phosphate synthase YjbQ (UPF0047 family)